MHAQMISRSLQTGVAVHIPSRRASSCRPIIRLPAASAQIAALDYDLVPPAPERSSRNIVLAIDTDVEGKGSSQHLAVLMQQAQCRFPSGVLMLSLQQSTGACSLSRLVPNRPYTYSTTSERRPRDRLVGQCLLCLCQHSSCTGSRHNACTAAPSASCLL
jgi:hypothetical protein